MEGNHLKKRWVYEIECDTLEDVRRVLVLDQTPDGVCVLTDTNNITTIAAEDIQSIRLAKLNPNEKCLWGVLVQLCEDYQSSSFRVEEELRFQGNLKKAMATILNGIAD